MPGPRRQQAHPDWQCRPKPDFPSPRNLALCVVSVQGQPTLLPTQLPESAWEVTEQSPGARAPVSMWETWTQRGQSSCRGHRGMKSEARDLLPSLTRFQINKQEA